jgi:hypothetical protein
MAQRGAKATSASLRSIHVHRASSHIQMPDYKFYKEAAGGTSENVEDSGFDFIASELFPNRPVTNCEEK